MALVLSTTPLMANGLTHFIRVVARMYDGNSFRDEYLRFAYPGEAIESPLPGYRLTYRILDAYFAAVLVISALLVWRHKQNIARLIAGTESRIGGKKA